MSNFNKCKAMRHTSEENKLPQVRFEPTMLCFSRYMYTHWLDFSFEVISQIGLSIVGNTPVLPRYTLAELCQVGRRQQPLVVVPVSDDVDGRGEDDHPRYGLVERQILVQQTFDGTRRALQ